MNICEIGLARDMKVSALFSLNREESWLKCDVVLPSQEQSYLFSNSISILLFSSHFNFVKASSTRLDAQPTSSHNEWAGTVLQVGRGSKRQIYSSLTYLRRGRK